MMILSEDRRRLPSFSTPLRSRLSLVRFVLCAILLISPNTPTLGKRAEAVRPLYSYHTHTVTEVMAPGTLLLDRAGPIEKFLERLDSLPPDWSEIYGNGEPDHFDRLFALNRTRDRARIGNAGLKQRVAFIWEGILSRYDQEGQGFRVAIGPRIIQTTWGDVRFKPYNLPANLVAVPLSDTREKLIRRQQGGETIPVHLILTGQLIREESLIYDFAHEEAGRGMVMPVVEIDQVDFFLVED